MRVKTLELFIKTIRLLVQLVQALGLSRGMCSSPQVSFTSENRSRLLSERGSRFIHVASVILNIYEFLVEQVVEMVTGQSFHRR